MKDGFKRRCENATTSLSSRHLGDYKSLLVFDDQKDKELKIFNMEMLTVYNTIFNVKLGTPLNRWKNQELS